MDDLWGAAERLAGCGLQAVCLMLAAFILTMKLLPRAERRRSLTMTGQSAVKNRPIAVSRRQNTEQLRLVGLTCGRYGHRPEAKGVKWTK